MQQERTLYQLNARNGGYFYAGMIALYVLISFLGQALMGALAPTDSTVYIAVCSTFSALSMTAVLVFAMRFSGKSLKFFVGDNKGAKFIPLSLLLSVAMFCGLGFVNDSIANAFVSLGLKVNGINVPLETTGQFILFSVLIALVPAVIEELFFRGLLLKCLDRTKTIYAVLISALCFSLYHASVTQLVYQFVYGVALALLFKTAKSILPCIVAHFANNFAVLCFQFFGVNVDLYDFILILVGLICLLGFFVMVVYNNLKAVKDGESQQPVKGEIKSFFFPSAVFALVICIVLAVGGLLG